MMEIYATSVPMSEDDLLEMKAEGLGEAVRSLFIAQLKAAEPVRNLFFEATPAPPPFPAAGLSPDRDWIEGIAVSLVCAAIGRSAVRDFHELIDRDRVRHFLEAELAATAPAAINASRALCDIVLAERASSHTADSNGNFLSAYLADRPQQWGERLFTTVTAQPFLTMIDTVIELSPGKARDKIVQALMIVGRLSPSKYQELRQFFIARFGATMLMQENQIRSSDYEETLFLSEVTARQSREDSVSNPVMDPMYSTIPTWSVFYGPGVSDFVRGPGKQFWSGARIRDVETKSAFSCFVAGTPLQLADGRIIPIETARPGNLVLADAGEVGTITADEIARTVNTDVMLYGINDMQPFFTSGHLIVTTDGLKAIDPALSGQINPSLDVGPLKVGDKVIHLVSQEPFVTCELVVEQLTRSPLSAGSAVYALALDGPQTYFAGNLLVSANYPVITEEGIAKAIERLSTHEREHLNTILGPVLPLLWEALGGFAGPRLRSVLQTTGREN